MRHVQPVVHMRTYNLTSFSGHKVLQDVNGQGEDDGRVPLS